MLERIIGSKARTSILRLFYLNENDGYHIREVSRLLNININQARNELEKLRDIGVLKKNKIANIHQYKLDKDFTLYKEFKNIIMKSEGIESILQEQLKSIYGIEYAFIFGSYAEEKFGPKSDIDLMIIGYPNVRIINKTISKIERKLCREIQYSIYTVDEFEKKRHGFIKNIMNKKKIFILGNEYELERTEEKRKN
ncbi:nucleotidyltransferase domain-containing protein [Candidatus Micrarchaeota archaeon]|nr:nucleotidyltransferase domain-containing protein [Candidatus Micrarchaeota archaeon]MBU1165901.1 nucleotidyltransferase domain-containing protein [Candidatus Micrarchaeota archaeon]MBU1887104.1 nucleotidyltransferase domain-containing protein [Candidatus Micrarchaeota archaeon]